MQIGAQQHAYVQSPGCPGCRSRRCTPTCQMYLLRQVLVAHRAASDLRPVPLGLMPRAYTRVALAIPGSRAEMLDANLLHAWTDARLWLSWRNLLGQRVVGTTLAVAEDGPDPGAVLFERGWLAMPLPEMLVRMVAHAAQPPVLPHGWATQMEPWMILPAKSQSRPVPHVPAIANPSTAPDLVDAPAAGYSPELLQQATQTLQAILAPTSQHSRKPLSVDAQADCRDHLVVCPMPHGADPHVPIARLSEVVTTLASSEIARAGLGVERVRRLAAITRAQAAFLLCWLDLAGLVDPPQNLHSPWRDPRPLRVTHLEELMATLTRVPPPTEQDIAAAFPKRSPQT